MQSSLKKSLYLGLAALSFAGVAAVSTTASAKSYAKAGAYTTLTSDATKRNVEATGSNALYTKPGTVKGAKVVASKATMAKLASSKKSADYFRAYGVKTTNRGSVYYRVVTMNGKYRGYIYGGKSDTAFAGGIKSADTTKTATKPVKANGYYLKDVSKNTLWTAPKYTQYKASKVNLYGSTAKDKFIVDNAATKTREGSLYYHVTDASNSAISGWIYAGKGYDATATTQDMGGLSFTASDAAATDSNSVKVNYVLANGNSVATSTFVNTATTSVADGDALATDVANNNGDGLVKFANADVPSGYTLDPNGVNVDSTTTPATPTAKFSSAKFGGTVQVGVYKAATSTITFWNSNVGVDAGTQFNTSELVNGKPSITTAQAKSLTGDVTADAVSLYGFFSDPLQSVTKTANGTMSVQTSDTFTYPVTISNGDQYHVLYTYNQAATAAANKGAKNGAALKAVFSSVNVKGAATPSTNDSGTTSVY